MSDRLIFANYLTISFEITICAIIGLSLEISSSVRNDESPFLSPEKVKDKLKFVILRIESFKQLAFNALEWKSCQISVFKITNTSCSITT